MPFCSGHSWHRGCFYAKVVACLKSCLAKCILDCWKEHSGILFHWLPTILIAFFMAPDQDHEKDDRSAHNISSKSCKRCEGCDTHYYWCHLDDTQKYFFKCMVGDFHEEMAIPEKFVENFKGQISEVIKLEAPDGNIHNVQAIKDQNKIVLRSGWKAFASFYKLKEGCVLVFRYHGYSHFRVLIFDYPSCCEKEVFHVVMNCGPNSQEKHDPRCHNAGLGNGESCRRCGHCDVHFYWNHQDDRQKHFLRLMIDDFWREMSIPEKFVKNFRGRISELIKLEAPDGNIYDIQVTKGLNTIVLGSRWAAFANAYELKEHDLLVFRYNGDSHFKVLIFEPSGCEKPLFHAVMNHAPNVQESDISLDQSFPGESRRRDVRSRDNDSRKTKKTTHLVSPLPRSAESVTSSEDTMSSGSGGLQETVELCYVLATGCNLTTAQKAEVDALANIIRPVIPFYITAINKTSLSGDLVICKDYAAKHLPHEAQFITLCHPQHSTLWVDNLKVTTDGAFILSAGWSSFVCHNKLVVGDICIFEASKSNGEVAMVVHTLEGGHYLPGKGPESQNKCNYPVKGEENEQNESYKEHAESNYDYSVFAKYLTGNEQEEIFRLASIQPGNPVYVAILRKVHLSTKNNMMTIARTFMVKHLALRSHNIPLLRPNRKAKWHVRYYYNRKRARQGFTGRRWTKFVHDNKLREGDVCVFELLKGMSRVTMMVHVSRKVDGRFVLLG